jgi:hypothetical protein
MHMAALRSSRAASAFARDRSNAGITPVAGAELSRQWFRVARRAQLALR